MSFKPDIFRKKRVALKRSVPFGSQKSQGGCELCEIILDGTLEVHVHAAADGEVSAHAIDTDLNEEYLAIHVTQTMGNFAGQAKEAYPAVLERVMIACFEALPSLNPQTNHLAHYLQATYGDMCDHPFERYPESSSYRCPQNRKRCALIMMATRGKLDLGSETWSKEVLKQRTEIINTKVKPKGSPRLLEIGGIYPPYHISEESQVSLVLDEAVSDNLFFSLVENSRALVVGKSLGSLSGPDYWIILASLKYYDIGTEFTANSIINRIQKVSIKASGCVTIYTTAPARALRYLYRVLESDILNSGYREGKSTKKLIKTELLQTFPDSQFLTVVLKECGITSIHGPRRMTEELVILVDSSIKS